MRSTHNLKKSSSWFWCLLSKSADLSKNIRKFFSNFMCFSVSLNFISEQFSKQNTIEYYHLLFWPHYDFCRPASRILSSECWARQPEREVVKIKKFDFSYWASSTPWGHVLSLKTFCPNPALSWAIRYSVFQMVKFTSSLSSSGHTFFSSFWHLVVKFGYN